MAEENKSKAKTPIVVGVCFAVAACAAIGLLILRKKNTKVDDNADNNDNTDDLVIDSFDESDVVETSGDEQETEKEEKSSYEKIADAVKPFCSPLVRNPKKKVIIKRKSPYRNHDEEFNELVEDTIVEANEKEAIDGFVDAEQVDETGNLTEPVDVSEPTVKETTEQVELESDFKSTAESMKEAETVVEEKPAMVEPPAIEIPKFTEEQIKSANDFVAEMKKQEPEFNQVVMIPVSNETIELCGFGVCAALLVRTGYDDKGDFTVRAVINRQGLPSEIKVYGDKADGFKIFTDVDEAKTFFQDHIAAATAIKAAPENFEESKRILLQTLAEDVEENP